MNIVCICMSPALDATVTLKAWPKDGDVVKDVEEVENVGGKGVNVARWLALRAAADPGRGVRVACGGLLGADNAVPFERSSRSSASRTCSGACPARRAGTRWS